MSFYNDFSLPSSLSKACILVLLLFGAPSAWAQKEEPKPHAYAEGEPHTEAFSFTHNDCISEEQRMFILDRLDSMQQELAAKGELPAPQESVVYFGWPLKLKAGVSDPSFYVTGNFIDENAGGGMLDYNCGARTYNGHKGTDIGTWPFGWTKMANNEVEIIAAAPGIILDKVDGNYDQNCSWNNNTSNWNAVYVYHADGSVAWYGHMKSGSVTSKPIGASVSAGEYLGVVGSSGFSTGPHLHFEVYNGNGALVDPWGGSCNYNDGQTWWANQKPYFDEGLCKLATHFAPPVFAQCPPEYPNYSNQFQPGGTVYFNGYYRDRLQNTSATYRVLRPNGTVWQTWSISSSGYYNAYYESNYFTLPSNAASGTWTFSATFNGQTFNHYFTVGNGACAAPTGSQIWASNVTSSTAQLNCSVTGALQYDWQYRQFGNLNWIGLPATVSSATTISGLTPGVTYEFQVAVQCTGGTWSAWSSSGYFTTLNSSNGCSNPYQLFCGSSHSASNSQGASSFLSYKVGSQTYTQYTGPEMIYQFSLAVASSITINLTGLSADLDLYLLNTCSPNDGLAVSGNSYSNNEQIYISSLPAGTYHISVDGWQGAVSNYNLSLSCIVASTCNPPTANQISATNVTATSARLNCSVAGALAYDWRYRVSPNGSWIDLPTTAVNYTDIFGLSLNTTYEFQVGVACQNGVWSSWSPSGWFITSGAAAGTCNNPVYLGCGNNYSSSNFYAANNYTVYYMNGVAHTGLTAGEVVHQFSLGASSSVTINLTGLSADLDLFLLSACNPSYVIAFSENSYSSNELIPVSNLAAGTYYIIVDGWNGATSYYNLSLQCNSSSSCQAPAANQISATNITSTSVRLNCSVTGVQLYDWSYRPAGGLWVDLPSTSTNFTDIYGLTPNTQYEYKVAVRCNNGIWSAWSASGWFTTPGNNNGCNNPVWLACGSSYFANNANGSSSFNCYTWPGFPACGWYAPEMVHQFTLFSTSSITLNLTGLSGDLDLFLLNSCSGNAVIAASGNSNNSSETITVNNLPAGTYLVIVDGWNYATSNYTLSLNCNNTAPGIVNDEPCSATNLGTGTQCIPQLASNVGATQTNTPPPPSGCNSSNMKDVWFRVQIPYTGLFYLSTQPGTLTDAVIGIYTGSSCSNIGSYYGCYDNNANGDLMPDLYIQGTPGTTVYLRIWGVNGTTGTFYICAQTVSSLQSGSETVQVSGDEEDLGDRSNEEDLTEEILSEGSLVVQPVSIGMPFPNPATDRVSIKLEAAEPTDFQVTLLNLEGKTAGNTGTQIFPAVEGSQVVEIPVSDLTPGIYLLRIESSEVSEVRKFVKQ